MIATDGAIIPAAVGVDIGCGMVAVETNLSASDLPDSLEGLRRAIEDVIPTGIGDQGRNRQLSPGSRARLDACAGDRSSYDQVDNSWPFQLGSLGGGNHFIEVALDERRLLAILEKLEAGMNAAGLTVPTNGNGNGRRLERRHSSR